MTTSWPQIRGLSYSTIGRTLRATVHGADGARNIWFAPPAHWRIERPDGTPQYIENESDEYRFREDGVAVHTSKAPNRMVSTLGLSPTMLFTAHRLWPMPGPMAHPQVGSPGEPVEVDVRSRRGWQLEFADLRGGSPISVVIDAESGVALSWRQDEKWLEMSDPVLDDDLDPRLFEWDGASMETEEQFESQEQLDHEQKMREVAAMPRSEPGWLPASVTTSPVDGDPLTGALDVTATLDHVQIGLRRWLSAVGPTEPGVVMSSLGWKRSITIGEWTYEIRCHTALTDHDFSRIIYSIPPVEAPVRLPSDILDEIAARTARSHDAEVAEQVGTGRELSDYLGADGGVSLLIRTDFTSDAQWRALVASALAPVDSGTDDIEFAASLTCIDNPEYDGLSVENLLAQMGDNPPFYAFMADAESMAHAEHPILAVNNGREEWGNDRGQTVRVLPRAMWSIENNLSISNIDFGEFVSAADDDGVYRGFPPPSPTVTTLTQPDLLELAATNTSTAVFERFALDMSELETAYAVVNEMDLATVHSHVRDADYSGAETLLGRDEYLAATRDGGIGHVTHVMVERGYWSLVLDVDSGRLLAAMLMRMPAY